MIKVKVKSTAIFTYKGRNYYGGQELELPSDDVQEDKVDVLTEDKVVPSQPKKSKFKKEEK